MLSLLVLATALAAEPTAPPATVVARAITFNHVPARAHDLEILSRFEKAWGLQVPNGDYWYDNVSGAAGIWGGPVRGVLGPGLDLGGVPVPKNASGGGDGHLTGVFINGREIHPLDVQGLTAMLGSVQPGSWWVDGYGNFGLVGQPMTGNLWAIANQRKGGGSYYKSDVASGSSTFVGSGCAAVSSRLSPSDSDSSYSYYVGCD